MKKADKQIDNSQPECPVQTAQRVKAFARSLGFGPVGITSAQPAEEAEEHLTRWLKGGNAAAMEYMRREMPRRGHPCDLLAQARSVICLAFNYYPGVDSALSLGEPQGRIARYAVGTDYHKVLKKKLRQVENFLVELGGQETKSRSFVDSAPILEREFARRAGLGFIGRNTHLITSEHGSWIFLSEVLTSLPLEVDQPLTVNCGNCTACLEACPTGALTESFRLDSRKCISYWTIEHKGEIPEDMREQIGQWVFGCDICQEVCPFNSKPSVSEEPFFQQGAIVKTRVALSQLQEPVDDEAFRKRFQGSPLLRAKFEGVQRNADIVAENLKESASESRL